MPQGRDILRGPPPAVRFGQGVGGSVAEEGNDDDDIDWTGDGPDSTAEYGATDRSLCDYEPKPPVVCVSKHSVMDSYWVDMPDCKWVPIEMIVDGLCDDCDCRRFLDKLAAPCFPMRFRRIGSSTTLLRQLSEIEGFALVGRSLLVLLTSHVPNTSGAE